MVTSSIMQGTLKLKHIDYCPEFSGCSFFSSIRTISKINVLNLILVVDYLILKTYFHMCLQFLYMCSLAFTNYLFSIEFSNLNFVLLPHYIINHGTIRINWKVYPKLLFLLSFYYVIKIHINTSLNMSEVGSIKKFPDMKRVFFVTKTQPQRRL